MLTLSKFVWPSTSIPPLQSILPETLKPPTTSNLVAGEVAINTADQKIYVRDSSSNIVEVANKGESLGTVLAMSVALG